MPNVKNYNQLFKQLQKVISESLKDEVADEAIKTMKFEIKRQVYDAYEPLSYERKYDDGGLVDDANILTEVNGTTLVVENIRRDENDISRNVAYVVETGEGYQYNVPERLKYGRPFTMATREELKNGKAVNALKKGLNNRGLKTE